jgi:cellobiose-specific phosphotransferase system component IIC
MRQVQNVERIGDMVHYVSLHTGGVAEVPLTLMDAIRVLIAPETRKAKSADQKTLATALQRGLVTTGDDAHHVVLTVQGNEAITIAQLLQA